MFESLRILWEYGQVVGVMPDQRLKKEDPNSRQRNNTIEGESFLLYGGINFVEVFSWKSCSV